MTLPVQMFVNRRVTAVQAPPLVSPAPVDPQPPATAAREVAAAPRSRGKLWVGALALTGVLAVLLGLNIGGWRQRLLGRPAAGRIQSVAVLPLENLTGDPTQEYFVDGTAI